MREIFTKNSRWHNKKAIEKLQLKQIVFFAAHIARSVLHVWEEQFPEDKRPRLAIEAALSFDQALAKQAANDAWSTASNAEHASSWAAASAAGAAAAVNASAVVSAYHAAYAVAAAQLAGQKWDWMYDLYQSMYQDQFLPNQYKTIDTRSIAKRISETKDFIAMPILADALEDANYPNDLAMLRTRPDLWNLGNYFLWELNS